LEKRGTTITAGYREQHKKPLTATTRNVDHTKPFWKRGRQKGGEKEVKERTY